MAHTFVVSGMEPLTMRYASWSRYIGRSSVTNAAVAGDSSEGFNMTTFPAAMAAALTRIRQRHNKTAGIERAYKWREKEVKRIIERAYQENDTLWLISDMRRCREPKPRKWSLFRSCPLPDFIVCLL